MRIIMSLVLLAGSAAAFNASNYPRSYHFPNLNAVLRWKVLTAASSTFEVALEADVPSTWSDYWVGFGITKAGGMVGADIVHYQSSTGTVTDTYSKAYGRPTVDDCQDWTFVSASTTTSSISGHVKVVVEMSRSVDTADVQDHALVVDDDGITQEVRLISAFGQGTFGYHGSSSRGTGATILYGPTDPPSDHLAPLIANTTNYDTISVLAQNHLITNQNIGGGCCSWEYYEFTTKLSDLYGDQSERFIVGIEAVIDQTPFVHHFVVALTKVLPDGSCSDDSADRTYIWAWGPGVRPLRFPYQHLGMRVNAVDSKCMWSQIHYDNPNNLNTVRDSSGVRIVATKPGGQAGMTEVGMLQIGDPNVELSYTNDDITYDPFGEGLYLGQGSKVGVGLTEWTFDCPQECLQPPYFTDSSVTILEIGHHMHAIGKHSTVEIHRSGQIVYSDTFDYFDFRMSGIGLNQNATRGDITLQQGDSMRMECFYEDSPSDPKHPRVFGQGSENEMCMAFVMYYPRQSIPESKCGLEQYCGRAQGNAGLYSALRVSSIPHSFGNGSSVCHVSASPSLAPPPPTQSISPAAGVVTASSSPAAAGGTASSSPAAGVGTPSSSASTGTSSGQHLRSGLVLLLAAAAALMAV